MLDFDLATIKFQEIQNLAHELSVNIHKDSLLYSNLQKVNLIPDPSSYLSSAIDKIESSTAFKELDKQVEEYVYQCESEASFPDLDPGEQKQCQISRDKSRSFALSPDQIIEQDFERYYAKETPSPLETWLRITDFYYQKVLNRDTSDWTANLVDDLKNYPKQKGVTHCFLALDGIYAGGVKLPDAQVIDSQSPEFSILNRIRAHGNYPEYFEGQYIMYYGVWPSTLQLKEFDHLHTKLVCRHRIPLQSLRDEILKSEVATLMLVTPSNVRAPNVFIVPESPFDANEVDFSATEPVPSCSWQVVGDYLDREDYLSHIESITVHEKEKGDFEKCCNTIYGILSQSARKQTSRSLEVPIYLYVQACEADNQVLSFLLFCTSLESLLIDESERGITEKFAARLALLIGTSEEERVSLYREGRDIYKLRSHLAHGAQPEESLKPYKHISRERMRELARQGIIAALTLNAILDRLESGLRSEVSEAVDKKMGAWPNVLEGLHQPLFDNRTSDLVQNAMRSWWEKRVSSAGKIIGVPFLQPAE